MPERLAIARSEFILGGQKSGKSRRAESLAGAWLAQGGAHRAVLIATAQPWDEEMRQRIERHQQDRAARVPGMATLEEARDLAGALQRASRPDTLVVVDCLTLWLTHWLMPADGQKFEEKRPAAPDWQAQLAMFLRVIGRACGAIPSPPSTSPAPSAPIHPAWAQAWQRPGR